MAVYDLYLRAHAHFFLEAQEGITRALALLSRALALEPDNARLLGLAAMVLMSSDVVQGSPLGPDRRRQCKDYARRGLQHAGDDGAVMAYCAMALIHVAKDYDWGMAAIRSAVEANPNDMMVVASAGIVNKHCGDVTAALTHLHRAIEPARPKGSLDSDRHRPCAHDPRRIHRGFGLGDAFAHAQSGLRL